MKKFWHLKWWHSHQKFRYVIIILVALFIIVGSIPVQLIMSFFLCGRVFLRGVCSDTKHNIINAIDVYREIKSQWQPK